MFFTKREKAVLERDKKKKLCPFVIKQGFNSQNPQLRELELSIGVRFETQRRVEMKLASAQKGINHPSLTFLDLAQNDFGTTRKPAFFVFANARLRER